MAIQATCTCGRRFVAKDHLAGKTVTCPSCGTAFVVPDSNPRAAAPSSESRAVQPSRTGSGRTSKTAASASDSGSRSGSLYSSPYDVLGPTSASDASNPLYAHAPATSTYQFADEDGPRRSQRSGSFAPVIIFGALTIGVIAGTLTLIGYFVNGLWSEDGGDGRVASDRPSHSASHSPRSSRPSTPPPSSYRPPPSSSSSLPPATPTRPDPLADFHSTPAPPASSPPPVASEIEGPPSSNSSPSAPTPSQPGSGLNRPARPTYPQPYAQPGFPHRAGGPARAEDAQLSERQAIYRYAKSRLRVTDVITQQIERMESNHASPQMVMRMKEQKQRLTQSAVRSICQTRNISESELNQILAEGDRQGW